MLWGHLGSVAIQHGSPHGTRQECTQGKPKQKFISGKGIGMIYLNYSMAR